MKTEIILRNALALVIERMTALQKQLAEERRGIESAASTVDALLASTLENSKHVLEFTGGEP